MKRIRHAATAREANRNRAAEGSLTLSRRGFLQYAAVGALAAGIALSRFSSTSAAQPQGGTMLILYFSHSGNTRKIAEQIHGRVGGDLVELKTVSPYPSDYDTLTKQAQREQQSDARPAIATEIPNPDAYDTVFIGFPNWWSGMPMPFFTLLEKYDLGSKTVVPFCTHGGGRFGHGLRDLKRLCPQARMLEGLEVPGSRASRAQNDVDAWLRKLGFPAD